MLDDLPELDDPGWGGMNVLGRLQHLHHHVLGLLADLAAASAPLEEGWLGAFGDRLTPDEVALLIHAASVDRRLDLLLRDDGAIRRLRRRLAHSAGESDAGPGDRAVGDDGAHDGGDGAEPGSDDKDILVTHPLVQLAETYRDTVVALLRVATRDGAAEGTRSRTPTEDGTSSS
ncbi:hypothetical protein ACI789_00420 [Geodermatophilus sp. SYSU D00965]